MAYTLYLIRKVAENDFQGVGLREKHTCVNLLKTLNESFKSPDKIDPIFKGYLNHFEDTKMVYMNSKLDNAETLAGLFDKALEKFFTDFLVYDGNVWSLYKAPPGWIEGKDVFKVA
jgi:hypothetical protein